MKCGDGPHGSNKISLALLRGRSAAQSVPSISFHFNTASDNITEISSNEDGESSESIEGAGGSEVDESNQSSAVSQGYLMSVEDVQGAAEKDAPSAPSEDGLSAPTTAPVFTNEGLVSSSVGSAASTTTNSTSSPGLFSRLSKSLEHKFNEIRLEKQLKERDKACISEDEITDDACDSLADTTPSSFSDKSLLETRMTSESLRRSFDKESPISKPTSISLSNSPSKKSGIAQDLADIRSELGRSIPKLSELRNRKAHTKDGKNKSSFTLNSLLGRDDGVPIDDLMLEESEGIIEAGVEAEEGIMYSQPEEPSTELLCETDTGLASSELVEPPVLLKKHIHNNGSSITKGSTSQSSKSLTKRVAEILFSINAYYWHFLVFLILVCFVLPIPVFASGFICGSSIVGAASIFMLKLLLHDSDRSNAVPRLQRPALLHLPLSDDPYHFKGWLNELDGEYCPESYHVSQTHSVLVRLQGSRLQVDHPRRKVSKHCRHSEDLHSGGFVHHREYNLQGATVLLLPRNLPRRWLWSRKYPICIRLIGAGPAPAPSSSATPGNSSRGSPVRTLSASNHGSPAHSASAFYLDLHPRTVAPRGGDVLCSPVTSHGSSPGAAEEGLPDESVPELESFEQITEEMCQDRTLYFFARADREKDDWFRRLVLASAPSSSRGPSSDDSVSFSRYMSRLLQPSPPHAAEVAWLNAMGGRLLYDFLNNDYWSNKIQERVQRKLSKVHVPALVGELLVCGVQLGGSVPQLQSVGPPRQDERGLWCDLSVLYEGNFTMTIETKLDLMRLKKTEGEAHIDGQSPAGPTSSRFRGYARSVSSQDVLMRDLHFDTDTDDSVESSSEDEGGQEEEGGPTTPAAGESAPAGRRRFLRLVDSMASSRYFQQATEWRLLQKAMRGVSNTRIVLSVCVERVCGTLTVNIPPQPSDRLWYGFRTPPELVMRAQPRLGDRSINLPFLADYIEKQLRLVFDKVFVLPNMDDLVVPIMSPLLPGQGDLPRPPWDTSTLQKTDLDEPLTGARRGSAASVATAATSGSLPETPDER